MDRHSLIHFCLLVLASTMLTACLDNKDSGTTVVTTETSRPFVFKTYPKTDKDTVPTTEIIQITFSEAVRGISTSNISISPLDTKTRLPGTALVFSDKILVLSSQDKLLSIKLANDNISLLEGTQYLVVIKGIVDYAGNVMTGSCEFIFSTTNAKPTESQSGPCKTQPGLFGFKFDNTSVAENTSSGNVEIIVERIKGSDGTVSVDYQTGVVVSSLVSATPGTDYTVTNGTLIFENGVTEQSIFIPIINDNEVEGDEIFNVSLTPGSAASLIIDPQARGAFAVNTITIIDDEIIASNVISFELQTQNINENLPGGQVVVTVRRSIATDAVSVVYATVDGDAKQGTDYQSSQGTLNFAVGEKVKQISIIIINDTVPEPRKSFNVNLSDAIGARINSNYSSVAIIINDDDQETGPGASVLNVRSSLKKLHFSWSPINPRASYILVKKDINGTLAKSTDIKKDLVGNEFVLDYPVHLNSWSNRYYYIQTCINAICVKSNEVAVDSNLINGAIGYFKASNTGQDDKFGTATELSDDGLTLAVGAPFEDSDLYGVVLPGNVPSRNLDNNNAIDSGAVYIYSRDTITGDWQQSAYIKATNVQAGDHFGASVTLSGDGLSLAVGADGEDSAQVGTQFTPTTTNDNNAAIDAGAVYVFTRANTLANWVQQAYIKASNTGAGDNFGKAISLSKNGSMLAIGAHLEDSVIANVVNVAQNFPVVTNTEASTTDAGAVYVFSRTATGNSWSQKSYLKSNKPDALDFFGNALDLSGDGSSLVVGAYGDDGNTNNVAEAGAIYKFTHDGTGVWSQQKYLPSIGSNDFYGWSVSISDNGSTMVGSAIKITQPSITGGPVAAGGVYIFYQGTGPNRGGYLKVYQPSLDENFGESVSISGDGKTLAIGIPGNDSKVFGADNLARDAGAVIVYKLFLSTTGAAWNESQMIKASNISILDRFGSSVTLNIDGTTLAVGAINEQSQFTGVKNTIVTPDPAADNSVPGAGAVYLY